MKRNVFVTDCDADELVSFVAEINQSGTEFDVCCHIANWKRTGLISELKRYMTYFGVGLKYFLQRKDINVFIGWQQFYALIFAFFCKLWHVKKTTTIIALNYTYKEKSGIFRLIYHWFMKQCMCPEYLDYIHVPSEQYAVQIADRFGFPKARIIVANFGIDDAHDKYSQLLAPKGYTSNGYALSIGRSNRDFDFLIEAWSTIDFPLVIISDTYKGQTNNPNIRIFRDIAGAESYPWIANCGLMVIPIDDGTICSGDTVLLQAMSIERKIIVTVPSTLAEMYIVDGENALLSSKNCAVFCNVVQEALTGVRYAQLGQSARESFLNRFSRRAMGKKICAYISADDKLVM